MPINRRRLKRVKGTKKVRRGNTELLKQKGAKIRARLKDRGDRLIRKKTAPVRKTTTAVTTTAATTPTVRGGGNVTRNTLTATRKRVANPYRGLPRITGKNPLG